MFTDSKHTIFDNVKAHKILKGNIPEIEMDIKPFSIHKSELDDHMIIQGTKTPTFSFKLDNDLLDFYGYPDISLSSNPEYRYKYPKLNQQEFSRQMRQTEQGTPNSLNQFLRADQTGDKIEDIKADDNEYQKGLQEIQKMIDEDTNKLIKNKDDSTNEPFTERAKYNLKTKIIDNKRLKNTVKNYNPVKINPAIPIKEKTPKMRREYDLLDQIKGSTTRSVENNIKTLLRPKVKPYVNIDDSKKQLNEEIEQAKNKKLKSIETQQPPLPTKKPDDEELENEYKKRLEKFENDLREKKSKLKTERQRKNETIKQVNDDFLRKIEEQNKTVVGHEKRALIAIDDIITELQGLTTKTLTAKKRKEVNEKLKEIDGSNIGAIKNVKAAINRLQGKKETINKSKEIVQTRKKETAEAERKMTNTARRNPNIVNVSNYPANDDESDFSVKKTNKDRPHFSGLPQFEETEREAEKPRRKSRSRR